MCVRRAGLIFFDLLLKLFTNSSGVGFYALLDVLVVLRDGYAAVPLTEGVNGIIYRSRKECLHIFVVPFGDVLHHLLYLTLL